MPPPSLLDALKWPGVVERYRSFLDLPTEAQAITLLEGATPLITAPRLAGWLGGDFDLRLKFEGLNPTGSFKDRGMTAAITKAVYDEAKVVICASTGNTAASAAAYAARAGVRCIVIVPEGKIAKGKLAGALAYGAEVIQITANFDKGLALVREAAEQLPVTLVNSVNPYRLEGQKTAAFEVIDALGDAPDWLCLPVGNAGNITSYWMGFRQFKDAGRSARLPQFLGVQAAGSAPIVNGTIIEHPETIATAIRIGNPARWREALTVLDESGGRIIAVEDIEILDAWKALATLEGVFVEPASAAGVAGLRKQILSGQIDHVGKQIVCVLTGHGLKDPDIVIDRSKHPVSLPPTLSAIADYLNV